MIAGLYPIFDHWHKEGTLYFYSDPHFGDKDLAKGQKGRISDEEQIARINSKVGKKDTLVILGDVGDIECAKKLRGRKILICGNHDLGASRYEEVFDEIYTGPVMIGEKVILSHEPIPNMTWAMNLHGHQHDGIVWHDGSHANFAAEAIDFTPVNMNKWFKEGHLKKIEPLHRATIDKATVRARKRGYKL